MNLGIEPLRTLAFVVVVFGNQAMLYAIRERRHLWGTRPSLWLVVSSVADIVITSTLAVGGIAMTPLPPLMVTGTLAAAVVFAFVLDLVKVPVFIRLGIADRPHEHPLTRVGIAKTEGIPTMETNADQPKASDSKPDANRASSDLTTQIAKRSYELYEERGRQDGRAAQDWEKAEREIRKAEPEAKAPSDLTPELVKRVHELYEALGRKDVQAVEELEKAEREKRKDEPGK
jgi:hypothetical protein